MLTGSTVTDVCVCYVSDCSVSASETRLWGTTREEKTTKQAEAVFKYITMYTDTDIEKAGILIPDYVKG